MPTIELYKSTYTGNALYGKAFTSGNLERIKANTNSCRYLYHICFIHFDWQKEKNGFIFRPGMRKLIPRIPYAYKIPPLHTLTGKKPPKKLKPIERAQLIEKPVNEVYKANKGELAFN